ncbi:MAG: symporter small accessory protein [Candidatus Humimicrobiaceae bacterium]
MLCLASISVLLTWIFCIAGTLFYVIYGMVKWNKE